MAMARLNLPSIFVYGGAALPGQWKGRDVTVLDTYEGVGAVLAGKMGEAELKEMEHICIPTLGSCPGQFTANTMAMVSETLGLALPGSAMLPAVAAQRKQIAQEGGKLVMELLRNGGPLPETSSRRKAWKTPAPPSPPPAARPTRRCTFRRSRTRPASASRSTTSRGVARTPLIADLKPGGRFLALDLHRVGGVAPVLKALLDAGLARRHAGALGARSPTSSRARRRPTGKSFARQNALHATGGVVVLKGNLAPDGALIKIAGRVERVRRTGARLRVRGGCLRGGHRARIGRATSPSSATRGRAAAPASARCSASPRSSTGRAWARSSASSPTDASRARRAA